MAKLKMSLVRIYAPRNQRKGILETLQRLAVMDLSSAAEEEAISETPEGFFKEDKSAQADVFRRNALLADKALDILNKAAPEKKGLLASFSGRRQIEVDEYAAAADRATETMKLCYEIESLEREAAEASAEIVRLSTGIEQMKPWEPLDVPLSFAGTAKTAAFIGTVTGTYDLERLLTGLAAVEPDLAIHAEIIGYAAGQTLIFAVCPTAQKEKAENALRTVGFARPAQNTSKLPTEKIRSRRERIAGFEKRIAQIGEEIASFADHRRQIELTEDYFLTRAEKYDTIGSLHETAHTVMITGYCAERDLPTIRQELENRFTVVIETEEPNEETAPVILSNGSFAGPAESITSMYALPSSQDIDPTPVTSFFYYLFFGMMLSDAGYGLLMVIATALVNKFLHPEKSMRQNMKLFMYCGISTTFWGLFFGSFFGVDIVNAIAKTVSGSELSWYPFIRPLDGGAMTFLILSLVMGFIQIIAGLCAKFVVCLKNGDRAGAFFDAGLWITTLLGIGLFAAGMAVLPVLKTVGAVIAILSAVGLVLTQGREKKGIMKIFGGLASLYDITSYVSDLLSFSRLMALGLTTAAMSLVFNLLGVMVSGGVIGKVFMVVVLLVGHAINFGLNALGAYVHTLRLQYVELFSKFYEGGGRAFKPFAFKSKFTRIKEDK